MQMAAGAVRADASDVLEGLAGFGITALPGEDKPKRGPGRGHDAAIFFGGLVGVERHRPLPIPLAFARIVVLGIQVGDRLTRVSFGGMNREAAHGCEAKRFRIAARHR